MIYEMNHVGILCRDMDRTLAFYQALDAPVTFDRTIPGAGTRIVYLQLGDGLVEYISPPDPGEDFAPGINHLAFLSDDLDRDHARLLAAGAAEAAAPKPAGTGVGRLSFLTVGDARIELLERDLDLRRPVPADSLLTGLDHYAMTAPGPAATVEFFTDVIGMQPLPRAGAGELAGHRYLAMATDVLQIGVADLEDPPSAFPHVTLRVDHLGAALTTLSERGVTGADAPEVARTGTCHRAILRDPDGIRLELVDRLAVSAPARGGIPSHMHR